MSASPRPGLIETMRMRGDGSIDRLSLHLSRLEQSAQSLAIPLDFAQVREAIASLEPDGTDHRVRLELSPGGDLQVNSHLYEHTIPDRPWRLAIAATRLDSAEPLLRHKTTFRDRYVKARQEFPPDAIEEVLLLNENDAVCEGTITTVFIQNSRDEPLLTPALECGLLNGVLRREMIDNGSAREAVLSVGDLRSAHSLFVGNSLRGLMPAILAE